MLCSSMNAESLFSANGEGTHFTEHFLASAAIFSGIYIGMHDGLGADKTTSFVFGAFTSLLIGFTYKYTEQMGQTAPVDFGKPMLYNAIGVAVPAVVLIHFDL